MLRSDVFDRVITPDLARVPVLEIVHREIVNDREITLAHIVRRNVFTKFDRQLSRHLSATQGAGFPLISVRTEMCDDESVGIWRPVETSNHTSVPAAMVAIAERALAGSDTAHLTIYQGNFRSEDRKDSAIQREIQAEDLNVMQQALEATALFGEPEFVDVSGDFDMIIIRPAGKSLEPLMIDIYNRMVSIPAGTAKDAERLDAPLFDLARFIASTFEARAYMAEAQRHLLAEKEISVGVFRAVADESILRFERALKGRALTEHRLEAVTSLVARLKAGLGESLAGLSEDARITALDWSLATQAQNGVEVNNHTPHDEAMEQPWVLNDAIRVN